MPYHVERYKTFYKSPYQNIRFNKDGNIIPGRYKAGCTKGSGIGCGKGEQQLKDYLSRFSRKRKPLPTLDNGYTADQAWTGLARAWLAYVISKSEDNYSKMRYYAAAVQKIQRVLFDVGLVNRGSLADFPNLGMSAFGENSDNAAILNEFVGLEEDLNTSESQQQRRWIQQVYNSDGLERVLF